MQRRFSHFFRTFGKGRSLHRGGIRDVTRGGNDVGKRNFWKQVSFLKKGIADEEGGQ